MRFVMQLPCKLPQTCLSSGDDIKLPPKTQNNNNAECSIACLVMYKQSVVGHMGSDLIYHTDCTHCCVDTPPARGGETFASIMSTEGVA